MFNKLVFGSKIFQISNRAAKSIKCTQKIYNKPILSIIQQQSRQFSDQKNQRQEKGEEIPDLDFNDPRVREAIQKLQKQQQGGKDKQSKGNEEDQEQEDEASYLNENKKSYYLFIVAGLGLIGGYFVMQMNMMREEKRTGKSTARVSYTGKADIGGPWQLYDTEGNVVTSDNLRGSYYLMYFGFCNCPDVCPQSLHKISKAKELIKKTPESQYFNLKTVFVSVDPDRDSPEKIKKFLALFDKNIIGLTGKSNESPELKDCMKKFKIYASKIEMEPEDNQKTKTNKKKLYTIDHTIITYLVDDENQYLTHIGSNMSEYDISQLIIDKILQNEKEKINRKKYA